MAARISGSIVAGVPPEHAPRRRMAAVVLNHRTLEDTCLAVSSLMASNRRPDHLIVVDNDVADECRTHFSPPRAQSLEPKAERPEPKAQGLKPAAQRPAPQAQRPEPKAERPEPSAESREPKAQSPKPIYLHTGRNLGFSGGMNVGIRAALDAGADLVLLVNSDIVVSPDCLERLESALLDHPAGGVAGPLVLSRLHPDRVTSAGIVYNQRTGRMRVLDADTSAGDASPARRGADAVSGCLMLVTRGVFDTIGLLDERYFFGFEDLDLCLRAKDAGFSTLVAGSAVAYHEGGRTIGRASARRFYFAARNHLLMASRRGPEEGHGARACRLWGVAALNLAHAMTADTSSLSARLVATARGFRDYLSGRYGPDPPT